MKFPGHGIMTQSKSKFSFACFTSGQENKYFSCNFSRDSTSAMMGWLFQFQWVLPDRL